MGWTVIVTRGALVGVAVAAGLLGCSAPARERGGNGGSAAADPVAARAAQAEIGREVRDKFGQYDETLAAAKAAGFDYLDLVTRALNRDNAALHELFKLSHAVEFEGEAVDDHAEVLGTVLRDVGERWFAGTLANEPDETQNEVRQYVAWDFGYQTQADFEYVRSLYPKVFPESFQPADYNDLPAGDEGDTPEAGDAMQTKKA